jgi:hypothetical protein
MVSTTVLQRRIRPHPVVSCRVLQDGDVSSKISSVCLADANDRKGIFILQGLLTVVAGMIGSLTIADFPEKAAKKSRSFALSFLSEKEAAFVVARIEKDRHDAIPEEFKLGTYLAQGLDLKVWGFASLFGLTTTVFVHSIFDCRQAADHQCRTYAIAYFLPIILKDGMGFGEAAAECLIAPPYVVAALWMFGCAVFGDKYHIRGPLIIMNALMGVLGLGLLGFTHNVGVRYFGVFLATTSANSNVPCVLTFQANNIRGQWKRALASATLVGAGGIGGIIGSTTFRSQDNPTYRPGMYTTMIASALIVVITALLDFKFMRANKRAAAGGKPIEKLPGFRYTL